MNTQTAIKQLEELDKQGKNMRLAAEEWTKEWKTLISIILSARTRDEVTIKTCTELFNKYGTIEKLSKADLNDIEKIIRPVNFYKNKSKNISKCAKSLVKEYKGKVPHDLHNLIELAGVGRKTANVFLSEYGSDTIGIDTHVSYISQKLEWSKNKNPEKIENDLTTLFPKVYWRKINSILVRFGKTYTSKKKKDKILGEIKEMR